jgi:hypothetical protein
VFQNRALKKIYGPKWEEEEEKLHNEELHDFYSSPDATGVVKPRRMRWWTMLHAWTL